MEKLTSLQQQFKDVVAQNSSVDLPIRNNNSKFSLEKRLRVYASAISKRFYDSLEEDYPLLKAQLGAENFKTLIEAFLKTHPSNFHTLAEVGSNLPKYMSESSTPSLAELARFEWAKICSNSPTETLKSYSPIASIEQENPELVTLIFDSSVQIFRSSWSVQLSSLELKPTFLLLYQENFEVRVEEVSPLQFQILEHLLNGKTIGEMAFVEQEVDMRILAESFSEWVKNKVIVGFKK